MNTRAGWWLASQIQLGGNLPFRLENGRYTIGRSRDQQIRIDDVSVSRRHAIISVDRDHFRVEDCNSRNGVFVERKLVKASRLQAGDLLVLGSVQLFVVQAYSAEEATMIIEDSETYRQDEYVEREIDRLAGVLTRTQREIMSYLCRGMGEAEIARETSRSQVTIHNHIQEIYRRLNVHSLADVLRLVLNGTNQMPNDCHSQAAPRK